MAAGGFPSARRHSEPGGSYLRENPPDERYRGTISLAPRIYEGGGPRSGRGSPPAAAGTPSQSRLRRASSPKGRAKGAALRSPVIPSQRALLLCNLADFAVGEFSGPVRLRERHFFVQFVENDEKYFFIPHFPIAFCAIWLYNEQKYCREGLYGRTHSHCFR